MFKRMFDSGLAVTILCASLILSACGSGSSGSSSSSGRNTSTLKAGLYEAKIEYVDGKPTQNATTFLNPTGKFAIVYGGDAGVSIGKLSFDGNRISGTSNDYRQVGPEGFIEYKGVEQGTINGTIRSQESATFSTSDTAGEVNTNVTLQRQNSLSDLGISMNRASGTYVSSEVALTVGKDGSLDAQYPQTTGCHLSGIESLSVPNTSINVFDITYSMTLCTNEDRNGQYSGVGFFGPSPDQQMQMVFAAHNETVAMKFQGTK